MVYIFALVGFAMGFGVGLGIINVLLRHKSLDKIKADRSSSWKYGLLVWIFAGFGGWAGVWLYNNFF